MADATTQAKWDAFIAEMKTIKAGVRAWLLLKKPMFDLWEKEGSEGIAAFVTAVLKGEAGRAEAMAKNTGSDTTTVLGFNTGLVERDAFWIAVQAVMAGAKIPAWLIPVLGEIIKQVKAP